MSKYKVTLKFYDENDRVVYLRIPPQAAWFMTTSQGTINEESVAALFAEVDRAGVPSNTRAVFDLPQPK